MRRALVGACILSVSVATIIACSSDSTDTVTPEDGGTNTTDTGTIDPSQLGDAGLSPNGCILIGSDIHAGKVAESVPRPEVTGGGIAWTNPAGALNDDGDFAQVTLDDGEVSAELRISDFGFQIPETYETWGMVVQLKRRSITDGGVIASEYVHVGIDGKAPGKKRDADEFFWPRTQVGVHDYGQAIDTWYVELFPSDLNSKTFSAKLAAKKGKALDGGIPGPVTAVVESMRVITWYCKK